uniref:Remorin C-terminal domain-containing protein n=1 Tax=Oryza glumipatula TaxID=40148 RepID=A0A0E0BL81_9ORYZ
MEPKSSSSSHYLQPSATLPSTRRNSFQGVGAEAGGGGMNPFGPTFSDPLCSLNLKETSEFVRSSFPMATMARSNSSNGATGNGGHGYHRETSTASSSSSSSASAQRRRAEQHQHQQQQVPATPGRPLLFFNSSSPAHHQLVSARRSVPSKWEDAEKWVRQASSDHHGGHHHHHGKGSKLQEEKKASAVRRSVDADVSALALCTAPAAEVFLKDKFTDNVEPSKESFVFRSAYCEPTKNTAAQAAAAGDDIDHRRDIGTEMTPLGSSTTSRCHTPIKSTSPARHNTPASRSGPLVPYAGGGGQDISDLADCHFAKLDLGAQFDAMLINWSSKEEEEEEVSKSLRHFEASVAAVGEKRGGAGDCRWEDDDRAKSCIRYQREEAKIQAWINLESAKAEAQSRKLEVKIQKMRSNLEEKLMRRMTTVHRRAEEWRATAQAQHLQQLKRAAEQVRRAKATSHHHHHHHLAGSNASCGCFPCNGGSNIISGNLLNYY